MFNYDSPSVYLQLTIPYNHPRLCPTSLYQQTRLRALAYEKARWQQL